jgi:uncharacterized protein with PIN domain
MTSLKLYLDEMIPPDLTLILKQYGYDILTAKDAGMLGKSDEEQLKFSASKGRTILTFNIKDFVKLHNQWSDQGRGHNGIVISPEIKIGKLVPLCLKLLESTSDKEIKNQIRFLQEFS